ncbi:MAG TPA: PaaI family thioesterase [Gemmatimonadales bacterium]|jgi:uncharacterized protein (TIGR00369 family)|nr:PaaI family thioesterase [Gemmatimonadales bacterium]
MSALANRSAAGDHPSGDHFRKLERAYASAPVTQWFGTSIQVGDGTAEVTLTVRPEFYHAAHAVHGSVYFRLLDDAAFFAANSLVTDVLVLTVSYTVYFVRPVASGAIRALGRTVHQAGRLMLAESQLLDADGRLLGQGSGTFIRSSIRLDAAIGYT